MYILFGEHNPFKGPRTQQGMFPPNGRPFLDWALRGESRSAIVRTSVHRSTIWSARRARTMVMASIPPVQIGECVNGLDVPRPSTMAYLSMESRSPIRIE